MNRTQLGMRTETGISIRMRTVEVEGNEYSVPKGIARNNRNLSWQVKVERNGTRLASGNFADNTYGGTEQALEAAKQSMVEELEADEVAVIAPRKVRGGRAEGMRIAEHVTVNWRIVNATPSLYATIYSPLLKKAHSIHLGSDRKLSQSSLAVARMLTNMLFAMAMNDRVMNENPKPFAPVDDEEAKPFSETVMAIISSDEFKTLLKAGPLLREHAEHSRGAGYNLSKIV